MTPEEKALVDKGRVTEDSLVNMKRDYYQRLEKAGRTVEQADAGWVKILKNLSETKPPTTKSIKVGKGLSKAEELKAAGEAHPASELTQADATPPAAYKEKVAKVAQSVEERDKNIATIQQAIANVNGEVRSKAYRELEKKQKALDVLSSKYPDKVKAEKAQLRKQQLDAIKNPGTLIRNEEDREGIKYEMENGSQGVIWLDEPNKIDSKVPAGLKGVGAVASKAGLDLKGEKKTDTPPRSEAKPVPMNEQLEVKDEKLARELGLDPDVDYTIVSQKNGRYSLRDDEGSLVEVEATSNQIQKLFGG
jgi:hypothetical protein